MSYLADSRNSRWSANIRDAFTEMCAFTDLSAFLDAMGDARLSAGLVAVPRVTVVYTPPDETDNYKYLITIRYKWKGTMMSVVLNINGYVGPGQFSYILKIEAGTDSYNEFVYYRPSLNANPKNKKWKPSDERYLPAAAMLNSLFQD